MRKVFIISAICVSVRARARVCVCATIYRYMCKWTNRYTHMTVSRRKKRRPAAASAVADLTKHPLHHPCDVENALLALSDVVQQSHRPRRAREPVEQVRAAAWPRRAREARRARKPRNREERHAHDAASRPSHRVRCMGARRVLHGNAELTRKASRLPGQGGEVRLRCCSACSKSCCWRDASSCCDDDESARAALDASRFLPRGPQTLLQCPVRREPYPV